MRSKINIIFAILLNLNILLLWVVDVIGFWDLLNMGVHTVARGGEEGFPYIILLSIVALVYFSTSGRALEKINWYERGMIICVIMLMFFMWISSFLTKVEALIVHFGGGIVVSFILAVKNPAMNLSTKRNSSGAL